MMHTVTSLGDSGLLLPASVCVFAYLLWRGAHSVALLWAATLAIGLGTTLVAKLGFIACGGTTVQPGDIIVGDDDGVVVIPPSLLQEVVDDAYEQELQDAWAYEQVKAGYPVDGMFPPNAEWKAKFAEYRKTLPDAPAPEGDA